MFGEDRNDVTASLDVTISSDPRIDVSAVDVVGAIPEYIISRSVPRYDGHCGMISKISVGDPALLWLLRQLRKLRQPMEKCRSDCDICLAGNSARLCSKMYPYIRCIDNRSFYISINNTYTLGDRGHRTLDKIY